MKLQFLLIFLFSITSQIFATDLTIENIRPINRPDIDMPVSVIFDISWKNSWNNDKNHDAVWVFMKFGGYFKNHVKILPQGHQILKKRPTNLPDATIKVSPDGLGFFIYPQKNFRGNLNFKLQIMIDVDAQKINRQKLQNMKVHGIEMVYIPQGNFTLGSPDKGAEKRAAFYRSDDEGKNIGLFQINSEKAIEVGAKKDALYYWSKNKLYNGDQSGPIPDNFPKGYNDFYIMKYELTQGQYAIFLNNLYIDDTYRRSPIAGRDYYKKRGGIRIKDGKYVADNPNRPMNFVSFTDGLAFTDWAALRPITELEYTKAARGTSKPIPHEFVWGTDNYDQLERYVNDKAELILANDWNENQLTDKNRAVFGASYYWVMDLSGSVWEKVITVGNETGRQFEGTHGDGNLSFGEATNSDWPSSNDEKGGFGYRGGGYYEVGRSYEAYNPHSPIGYRYYGAWSGGPRSIAYGYRAGRSAN